MMSGTRLETPKQLATRVGVSERQVRHLIQTRQLDFVQIGCRVHIPAGAWERFIKAKTVRASWDAETKDHACAGSKNAGATTSVGPSVAAAASAALARTTANALKSSSRNGSKSEDDSPAQVIPLKSS